MVKKNKNSAAAATEHKLLLPAEPQLPDPQSWLDKKCAAMGLGGKVLRAAIEWIPVVLVLYFYALIKFYGMRAASSDENIYFYMGWAMVDHGAFPYKDYFFAHPPLQILLMAGWIALFGFKIETAKMVPWLAFVISAIFFHRLLRSGQGRISSLIGLIFYVFAYDILRASAHFTGINCTIMFLVPGLWAMWRYKNALAGVFFSLAALTGTYAMPAGGLGLLWVAFGRGKKATWRYVAGLAIPYLISTISGMIMAGPSEFLNMQFRYHVIKPEQGGESWKRFLEINYDNNLLALGMWIGGLFIIGMILYRLFSLRTISAAHIVQTVKQWAEAAPHRVRGLYALGMVLIYLTFYFNLKRVFPFYYLLVFSSMAWLGAFAIEELIYQIRLINSGVLNEDVKLKHIIATVSITVIALFCFCLRDAYVDHYLPRHRSSHDSRYTWHDAPYLSREVNDFMRKYCWQDVAKAKTSYNDIYRIMWHETFFIDEVYPIAQYIKEHTTENDMLFGDSTSLPLIALLAERRIIDDYADTNIMRFRSGVTDPSAAILQVNRPELAYLIPRKQTGFFRIREFQQWAARDFVLEKTLKEPYGGLFMLYHRKAN